MKKYRGHTTHYACDEVMKRDGGKAIGCCCSCHECKDETPLTLKQIIDDFEEKFRIEKYHPKLGFISTGKSVMNKDATQYLVKSIKDALEACRVEKENSSWKRTEQEPTDDERVYYDGWNTCTTQYDENVKAFLGDKD